MIVFSGRIFCTIFRAVTCGDTGSGGVGNLGIVPFLRRGGDGGKQREISCFYTK